MVLWLALAGAVVAVVAGVAVWRKRAGSSSQAQSPAEQTADLAKRAPQTPAPAPAATAAPLGLELKAVSCETAGAVHGAMPPFGSLRVDGDTLRYQAGTRLVAMAGGGLASGDGASTMQSLGSVERGDYQFAIARAEIRSVTLAGSSATVEAGTTFRFEGLGASGGQLAPWLRGHGFAT